MAFSFRRHQLPLTTIIVIALAFFAFSLLRLPYRLALAWDAGVIFYIGSIAFRMRHATAKWLREQSGKLDLSDRTLFAAMIAAGFYSLYLALSILHVARDAEGFARDAGFALALMTVVLSWLYVQMTFAVHYAHQYYMYAKQGKDEDGGLEFPKSRECGEKPDFWDFMYFSFVLGMTFQVSDVQVTRHHMRHLALAHGVIAFFFNSFILALSVNIAASMFE